MTDTYDVIIPQHIDSTILNAFRSCPKKMFYEYCMGLRASKKNVHLHAGKCFAKALEVYYHHIWVEENGHEQALLAAWHVFASEWGDYVPPEKEYKTKERMWEAVVDYLTMYPAKTDPCQPYFLEGYPTFEFTFAIPLEGGEFDKHPSGEPFVYCGRFDLLGKYNGIPCVRDEKTSKYKPDAKWAEKWSVRSQFMGYVWACQMSGIQLEHALVRGITIQKTQFHHIEALKTYNKFMLERWYESLVYDINRIAEAARNDHFPRNFGDACDNFGLCTYSDLCTSRQPESWYSQYIIERWNPLD